MTKKPASPNQPCLFDPPADSLPPSKFISTYRVSLVRDRSVPFEQCRLINSQQALPIIRALIEAHGQSDREQFCVILLNTKNEVVGLNIVATGTISSAQVSPREVFKPAILANSAAMILCHNHPSGDVYPSAEDQALTEMLVRAAAVIGIEIHEHLIVSMEDDRYYSFADHGLIKKIYDAVG